ncbi:MAG: hypothetical protein ACLQVA_18625 [Candidatus Brocadiia bacterium]
MPPEHLPPEDPREWLNRARSNLAEAVVQWVAQQISEPKDK